MADVIWREDLEAVAEELGLEHEDFDRLESYVSLVRSYPLTEGDTHDYIREHLEKWIQDEGEHYYGEHESPGAFAKFYFENYDTESSIATYLVVDWEETWDRSLCHDFHFERTHDNLGYVWSEIY